jgi:ketosteroid isomerase-like protein
VTARPSPTSSQIWRCRRRATATTSSPNVEAVTRLYALFSDGRVEEAASFLDPDIEWSEPPEQLGRRVVKGRDAAYSALTDWLSTWSEYDLEITDVLEAPEDRVLICMVQWARGGATGIEVRSDLFQLWTLRGDVPIRMEMFFKRDAALEAAGLG